MSLFRCVPMLRLSVLLAALVIGCPAAAQPNDAPAVPLRVMSFNVRLNIESDSLDAWPHRRESVVGLIRFYDPDLVGLQEPQRNQLDDLARGLPGYTWFGQPRADGGARDEFSAVLYRTDRLELLDRATFWLSETPEEAGSKGWDAAFPRIVTWGRFRDRATGDTLFLFNTHLDHVGEKARAESARLIRRRVGEIAEGAPVIVTGDFNTTPDTEPYRILTADGDDPLVDSREVTAEPPYGPTSTWNGFDAVVPGRRIDFVFVGEGVRVLEHGILAETRDGVRFPSDHLPVLVEVVVE